MLYEDDFVIKGDYRSDKGINIFNAKVAKLLETDPNVVFKYVKPEYLTVKDVEVIQKKGFIIAHIKLDLNVDPTSDALQININTALKHFFNRIAKALLEYGACSASVNEAYYLTIEYK